jgi:hypothetical protein
MAATWRLTWILIVMTCGCVADERPLLAPAGVAIRTTGPPPPPRVQRIPTSPGAGWVWVGGRWVWRHQHWVWAEGRWRRLEPGFVWVRPRAYRTSGTWRWARGFYWHPVRRVRVYDSDRHP